jgi:hypothetical protein
LVVAVAVVALIALLAGVAIAAGRAKVVDLTVNASEDYGVTYATADWAYHKGRIPAQIDIEVYLNGALTYEWTRTGPGAYFPTKTVALSSSFIGVVTFRVRAVDGKWAQRWQSASVAVF